jgi:YVTN family beta-propeller protein
MRRLLLTATLAALLVGCGGARHRASRTHSQPVMGARPAHVTAGGHRRRASQPHPHALITDESQDLLAIVDLRSRTARSFIGVAGGPQYVAAQPGVALVTSPTAGAVTLLNGDPLRVANVFHGFGAPHIVEITPDGEHAYVTDDARGTLTVIGLTNSRVTDTVDVGAQAHHMASSPDQRLLWIALGERSSSSTPRSCATQE